MMMFRPKLMPSSSASLVRQTCRLLAGDDPALRASGAAPVLRHRPERVFEDVGGNCQLPGRAAVSSSLRNGMLLEFCHSRAAKSVFHRSPVRANPIRDDPTTRNLTNGKRIIRN